MADSVTQDILKHSVTGGDIFEYQGGGVVNLVMPYMWGQQTALALPTDLPPYYTASTYTYGRDIVLRSTIIHESAFWGSAVAIAATKAAAQSFDIDGDQPRKLSAAHEMMVQWGGDGYVPSQERGVMDFCCTDNGEFWEVVRASSAAGSRIVGLVHLDSLRCRRTGDPETPVIYWDLRGKPHDLRAHQVLTLVDMPDPSYPVEGIGHCAAERAYPEIYKMSAITRFLGEKITGSGAHQIAIMQGITSAQLKDSTAVAQQAAQAKGLQYMQGTVMIGVPGDAAVSIETLQLRGLPENFDRKQELDISLLAYANALGLVLTDLQPLSGQGLGTGAQSVVLEEKATGRGLAARRKQMTHLLNEWVMPDRVTFAFSERDPRDEKNKADAATAQVGYIAAMVTAQLITPAQGLQMAVDMHIAPQAFMPKDVTPDQTVTDEDRTDEATEQSTNEVTSQPEQVAALDKVTVPVVTKEAAIDFTAIKARLLEIREALQ